MTAQTWTYRDDAGLASAVADGEARALSLDWTTGTLGARTRALRGVALETARAMALLVGAVEHSGGSELNPLGSVAITPVLPHAIAPGGGELVSPMYAERHAAAARMYATLTALRFTTDPLDEAALPAHVTTIEAPEATGFPMVAVAVVAVAQAAAIAYVADRAAQVIDRQLSRNAKAAALVREHTQVLKLVEAHHAQEKAAGSALPLSAATKAALGATHARQTELVQSLTQEAPLPSAVLPSTSAGWFSAGLVAAAAAVLWFVTSPT